MAESGGQGGPEIVLLGTPLPQWVTEKIAGFDLRVADEACDLCRSARVAIAGWASIDDAFFDRFPAVEYVVAVGSGYENIDVAAARRRGITVSCNAAGPTEDVADHTLALILALHLRLVENDARVRAGDWPRTPQLHRSLSEINVGIVGLGLIGQAIARRLEPFGCAIRWTGPRRRETPYDYVADLPSLADWADVLVVAARADASNAGMIDADILAALGPAGMLVNISRGSIVDEDSLIAMLRDGRLGGAALDVFQSEPTPGERWRDVPNTLLSPHVAGYGSATRRRLQDQLAANVNAFFKGETLTGVI